MKKILNKKYTTYFLLVVSGIFSLLTFSQNAFADIGDIGHWRDSVGSQIPATSFTSIEFASQIQNDNSIYSKPDNATIQFSEAGDYLVISSVRYNDNSNGRFNPQSRIALTAGTGDVFTSHYTGYSRSSAEDQSWVRATGLIIGASSGTRIQVQDRRDTDAPTGGTISNESDVQVIRINPTNYGIYNIGGTGNLYGGTSPNTVSIDSVISESSTSAVEGDIGGNNITIKGDNKRYLVGWSVSFDGGNNSRTQRIGQLEYNGVDNLATRSYCYRRFAADEYCGLGSMDIIETGSSDIVIQAEVYRGDGNSSNQGGASNNSNTTTDGRGQLVVLEMPDSLEIFRSHDSVGGQNVTTSSVLNIARDVDFNDSFSFTKVNNTNIGVTSATDLFAWANIWTARSNVSSTQRQTSYGSIVLNGVEQSVGEHGSYSRGNQGSTDTFAMAYHPAGIYTTGSDGETLGVNSSPLVGGANGGGDNTRPGTLGFFAMNLDTLVPPVFEQSAFRFFENNNSTAVGLPLGVQDTSVTLATIGQEFRLRALINLSDNKLRQNAETFKLQFAEKSGTCDSGFSGETYSDVTGSSAISFNDNSTPSNGDNLLANPNDPTNGLNTIVGQSYVEQNNFSASGSVVQKDQDGKWDFSLVDSASPNTSYCFRIVESDGTLLDNYSVIPEITTAPIPPAFCPAPVTSFPYSEGFEGGVVGAWEQSTLDDNDWFNHTLSTTSNGTGPTSAIEGSRYLYVEASTSNGAGGAGSPNKTSILTSPCFELDPTTPYEFDFQYHMFGGTNFGTFDVEISNNGISWFSLFNQTLDQGNQWNQESLDLSPYLGQKIRLRLNRFVATDWKADVAVDDIVIKEVPLGSAAVNPFTSLAQAYSLVSVAGIYYFDLNGETFDTYVDANGWVLVASGESTTTESSYSQVSSLNLQTDLILNSDIVAEMTEATELRINATSGPDLPFDVTSSNSLALSRFLAFTSIGYDTNINPLNGMFSGTDTNNVLAPSSACNAGSLSLDLRIIHNCGNAGGIHWTPSSSLENVNHGSVGNDLNLWVRAALVDKEITFSLSDNSVGFDLLDVLATRFASGDLLGSVSALFAHSVSASTNATSGYEVEVESSDFLCTSCDDPGISLTPIGATAVSANPGLEQFGLRVVSAGTGSVELPYNSSDYAYDLIPGADVVLTGIGNSTNTDFNFEYIADINPLTPAGEYEMTLTYTMHATF